MVQVAGVSAAVDRLKTSLRRVGLVGVGSVVVVAVFYGACTARVKPNQFGVEQRKFGLHTGIVARTYGPGLYFVGVGATMHTFPRRSTSWRLLRPGGSRAQGGRRVRRRGLLHPTATESWAGHHRPSTR
jgi:hypothetical protein